MEQDKVLATVNGKDISSNSVNAFINQMEPQMAAQFRSPEGIKKIANELVNQELLYLEAIDKNLDQEDVFKRELEIIKENTLKQYAINKLLADIMVSEDEISKFYDEHKEHFQTPEKVRASHILVEEENDADKILREMEEGLSFGEAARKYSICPSKEKDGDLGEFGKGQMVPEFEEVAFSMEEGKISDPVKTQFGYHLIKLDHKKAAGISSLEEVKDQIRHQILMMKQQETYLNKTEELKSKYEVKTYF